MKSKIVWLILSCLIVLALVLASCGPAAVEEEGETVAGRVVEKEVKPEEEKEEPVSAKKEMITDALGRKVEKPQYGGTAVIALLQDPVGFDPYFIDQASAWTMHLTNECPEVGDFTAGPSGRGEVSWGLPGVWSIKQGTGCLAESWEWPDNETIIYHIRKGVRFHDIPPVNGREMTAEDVVYSIKRFLAEGSWLGSVYRVGTANDTGPTSVEATDKWTVVVKTLPESQGTILQNLTVALRVIPHEMVEQYGDMTDWKSACGTGPYILTDYVRDGSVTFARNPNYWRDHPLYPGMKLPFPDRVRALVIEDTSTQIAALRTGKIDELRGVDWTDSEGIMNTNPEIKYTRYLSPFSPNIWYHLDNEDLPYQDIRVRRALAMAIDREAIIEGIYNGNAEKYCHPVVPLPELSDMFVPLEELPETAQELYKYDPEKAKTLLAEAGYPNGFKAKITCSDGYVDLMSIVKEMWADVGVELELDVKERGVYRSLQFSNKYEDMLACQITNMYYTIPLAFINRFQYCHSRGYDEYIETYWEEELTPYQVKEDHVLRANLRKLVPYLVDLAWSIELPTQYLFVMWQPWLKSFNGEYSVGRGNHGDWPIYVWIDRDLKYELTGQRD